MDDYGNVPLDDVEFDALGQNNWIGGGSEQVDWTRVVHDWFSESHDFDHDRNRCRSRATCTDYTQVESKYRNQNLKTKTTTSY